MRAGNKSEEAAKLVARQIGVSLPTRGAELRRLLQEPTA
jgi:hypothetical protein